MTVLRILLMLLLSLLLAACASSARSPDNPALAPVPGKPVVPEIEINGDDAVLMLVAFSGGGNRAAAFSYGVLEALHETQLPPGSRKRSLVEEIDIISAVSGGSIPAAYYGLVGEVAFENFRPLYLEKNTREGIRELMLSFSSLSRLGSESFGSGDVLDEYFRRQLFGDAMLGQLLDSEGPYVQINATDLFKGGRFPFSSRQFALICSDVDQFPVARAVAASSGVPLLFSPITLVNRSGQCGYPAPEWLQQGLLEAESNPRRHRLAKYQSLYLDREHRPYIHLVDGGLADNLGLRAAIDRLVIEGGLWNTLKRFRQERVSHIAIISVDASALPPSEWELSETDPTTSAILDAATTAPLTNYNFETVEYLRSNLQHWQQDVLSGRCRELNECHKPDIYFVQVRLEDIVDPDLRKRMTSVPTDFVLAEGTAEELIAAAKMLLATHPEFMRLKKALSIEQ